jgi:hypothetical protein
MPYEAGKSAYSEDPGFDYCPGAGAGAISPEINDSKPGFTNLYVRPSDTLDTCREAWALRILNSANVYLYGGGFYSFFNDYKDTCSKDKSKVATTKLPALPVLIDGFRI